MGPAYFFTTSEGHRFALSPRGGGEYGVSVQGAFDPTLPNRVWMHTVSGTQPSLNAAFSRAARYYTENLVRPVRRSLKRERKAGDRSGKGSSYKAFVTGREPSNDDFVTDWLTEMEREGRSAALRERLAKARKVNPRKNPLTVFRGKYVAPAADDLPSVTYTSNVYVIGGVRYVEVRKKESGFPEHEVYDGRVDGLKGVLHYEGRLWGKRKAYALKALTGGRI